MDVTFFFVVKVLRSMPTTMLDSLKKTGKEFRIQGGVSSAMTQTELEGLELASTLYTTQQVKICRTATHYSLLCYVIIFKQYIY